jgi:hypothetical protein
VAVKRLKPPMQVAEVQDGIDLPKQMVGRNPVFQAEFIKQPRLSRLQPTHHRRILRRAIGKTESRSGNDHEQFFNSIDP